MSDEPSTERGEDDAGWAVPDLEARAPQSGPESTAPAPPPGSAPDATTVAAAPAAPPPGAPAPTDSWALPAGGVAAGATPRKRRGWIVALVLALGAIALLVIAGTALFVDRSLPPYQGAYDFLDDITSDREQDATDRLCAADQDDPQAAFTAVVRRIGFNEVTVNALGVDRDGDRATVEITVGSSDDGDRRSFDLPMHEEGGEWKACPGELRLQ
jgi:hypothetical protein